jgi:hypothetical protein
MNQQTLRYPTRAEMLKEISTRLLCTVSGADQGNSRDVLGLSPDVPTCVGVPIGSHL